MGFFCFQFLTERERMDLMKVKDTLNLGKTKFPMRGNLSVSEVQKQKEGEENKG